MPRRNLLIYADTSVIGGCEDPEFRDDSLALWEQFKDGRHRLALSEHTLRELQGAPAEVRARVRQVPTDHVISLPDTAEAFDLADAYLRRGVLGAGSHADALHVALATTGHANVLVSWNFRQIVNVGRIWIFNAVNIEEGYGTLEIRTPKEVLEYE